MNAAATLCGAEALVIALPLAGLLWLCGSVSPVAAFAAMTLATLIVLCTGAVLLRAIGAEDASPAAAWVLGMFASSLALYALVAWLDMRATSASIVVALVAGGFAWRYRVWRARLDARDLLVLALCGAATLLWSHHSAAAPAILSRLDVLPVWIDYAIHGGIISGFGDPLAQGAQSIELAGFPRPFYHYASYLMPAVLAAPLDLPGLPLATSVWLPLGVFTLCAGAYAFGQVLAGQSGGVGAVAALALVPDAGDYGLRNAFFGFKWHVLTHPSAAYALGIALVSFAFLRRWREERRPLFLAASLVLATGLLFFRAHVFVLALPCVVATAAIGTAEFRRRWPIYTGAALALLAAVYFVVGEQRALPFFLDTVHHQPSIAYAGWYDAILQHYGAVLAVPVGLLLVFPVFLGIFTLLYPMALWLRRRSAFDAMPMLLVAGYAALMLLAPIPANGDPTELTQRPFVLVYAAIAVWTCAVLAERLSFRRVLCASGAALILLWPQSGLWSEFPKFSWGWNYYARSVTPGLLQAATFLRAQGKPGDVFAAQGLQGGWVPTDIAVELTALSGMPAYLARPYIHEGQGIERHWVAQARLAALQSIARETQAAKALARLGELGVHWHVVAGDRGPAWDPDRQLAAFTQGKVAVYRTTNR